MKRLSLIIFVCIHVSCFAEDINAKVTAVIDGNTFEILTSSSESYTIVLSGIDCPELTQEFGEDARKHIEKLILQKDVIVQFQGKDRMGNHLAIVFTKKKEDVRIELLRQGLAWTAERNPNPELESHRTEAQQKQKGLWKNENPLPPWVYRRQQSMLQAKG